MADESRRATILALAQLFRADSVQEARLLQEALDRPLDHPRNDLMRLYDVLEDIRNTHAFRFAQLQKRLQGIGAEMPGFAVDRLKATNRGIDVWLCTLGGGISPAHREDVRVIWNHLKTCRGELGHAILRLRETERRIQDLTLHRGDTIFAETDTKEWLEACRFVPSAFAKDLAFN